jgi:hypothetical protein
MFSKGQQRIPLQLGTHIMGGSTKGENHLRTITAQQKLVTHEYIKKQMQKGQFQNVEEDSKNHRKF